MEGSGSPYADSYVKVMNDWNYDESCMVTSRRFQFGAENFRHLIFVANDRIAVSSSLAVSDN